MGIRHIQVYDYEDLKREHYYLQGTFSRKLIPIVHDHNFYEIAYVLHGCCRHIVNNRALDMREGEMILLRPGDTHGFSGQSPHTNLLSLSVCEEEMHYFLQAYGAEWIEHLRAEEFPPFFRLTAHQQNEVRTDFERILTLNANERRLRIRILLDKLLQIYLLRVNSANEKSANSHFLDALTQFNTPACIREGVPALLRLTAYSHAHLCRIMKNLLGTTPQKYVVSMRLNLALELLQNSDMSVDAIIEQIGYASPSHFASIFAQKFGMTPSEARRKARMQTV